MIMLESYIYICISICIKYKENLLHWNFLLYMVPELFLEPKTINNSNPMSKMSKMWLMV